MKDIVESILSKNYDEANSLLENAVQERLMAKIFEMKKITAARLSEQIVQPNGMVRMATGEEVLPSIARHRRGLSESTPEIKIGRSPLRGRSEEERFSDQHKEAEKLEAEHDALEDKEWEVGVKKGQTPIIEYKKKREKLLDSLRKDAYERNPNDHVAAAKDVHAKILQNHSNEGIGQYYGHAHKFEDLHPTVRERLLIGAKRTAEHEEKMKKDPMYAAKYAESVKRGEEAEERFAADKAQQDAAMKAFVQQQNDARAAREKQKGGQSWSSRLNDEIPYEE